MSNQDTKYNIDRIINQLSEPEVAIRYLIARGIVRIKSIESVERYEISDDRKGIIMRVQEEGNDGLSRMMIDIRKCQPSTDQVYDAIYGSGKDCSRRLVLFTNEDLEQEEWDPAVDEIVVKRLAATMSVYPLRLHVDRFDEGDICPEINEIETFEEPDYEFSITDLPSGERFRAEEFWSVYYDSQNEDGYKPGKAFSGGFREISNCGHTLYTDPNFAEISVYWNAGGIGYVVKQTDESNDYLKTIWALKPDELRRMYNGRVDFEYLAGKIPKIHIRYSDRPISWLVTATSNEKFEFARQLHEDLNRLREFLSEAMAEVGELNAA